MVLQGSPSELPTFPGYEVLGLIGEGSMASVYRGRHRANGTPVAIKVPLPEVADNPVLLQRFRQEFQMGNALNHPNIVRALDFGQQGQTYFLVMEFVDGQDLWERIAKAGRLPEAEAVAVVVQVARGLHEAHKHGVVHRDVKPDNVLLSADGRAKLGDLGLIKDLEGDLQLTRTRKGLGTPNFMAPEQFSDARHATFRCDVYSLGATLYMAVTGELPFLGRSLAATLQKKLNDELVPPRQLVPGLSERVEWTIRRAVQADPQRRHASCLEFIQALTGEDTGTPPTTAPPAEAGATQRPGRERRKRVRHPCTHATVCDLDSSIHEGGAVRQKHWEGTVQDLSAAGVGLVLSRRFEPGTTLTVLLESPDRSHQRSLELQVVRVSRASDARWFLGGLFAQPLDKEELKKLL